MSRVVRSKTCVAQLKELLEQGVAKFGTRVALEKWCLLDDAVDTFLAVHPRAKRPDTRFGLHVYPVTGTPFLVIYDFDDHELRVHFIVHRSADLRDLGPATVEL